jgi:hypothetical protein
MVLGIGLYSAITAAVTSYFVNSRAKPSSNLVDDLERLAKVREALAMTDEDMLPVKTRLIGGG